MKKHPSGTRNAGGVFHSTLLLQNLVLTPRPSGGMSVGMIRISGRDERRQSGQCPAQAESVSAPLPPARRLPGLPRHIPRFHRAGHKALWPLVRRLRRPAVSFFPVKSISYGSGSSDTADKTGPRCDKQTGQPSQNCHATVVLKGSKSAAGWVRTRRTSIC